MFNLPDSILIGAHLNEIVEEVAKAGGPIRFIYVERRGTTYRWSPAHKGGPYPLLRETARYLGTGHHTIILPFRQLAESGLAIIDKEPRSPTPPDSWTIIEFEAPLTPDGVRVRVQARLHARES